MKKKVPKIEKTPEEIISDGLRSKQNEAPFLSQPTIFFERDEEVDLGNLEDCKVVDYSDDRRYYLLNYNSLQKEGRVNCNAWHSWTNLQKKECSKNSFSENYQGLLRFNQETISSLLLRVYSFGVDFDVDYQRDYVWSLEDKQELIHSIFQGLDIGKFVFVDRKITADGKCYEILDGKQRLSTIIEFYENKFQYNGLYYYQLSKRDKNCFKNHAVSSTNIKEIMTKKQVLNLFIRLNTFGKVMDKKHLEKVNEMMKEI